MADFTASQGNWETAIHEYGRALSLAADKYKLRLRVKSAELCLKSHMYVLAETRFAELSACEPGNAVYMQGLGLARFAQDRLDQAKADLQQAVGQNPQLWRAYNALGIIANRQRRPQRLEHFRKTLARDQGYRLATNNLGLVLAKQGRTPEALRAFEKGAGPAQAHYNMGVLLAQQGQYNQTAQKFRQAVETMPRYYPLAGRHLEQIGRRLLQQPTVWHSSSAITWPAGQELPRVERPGLAVPAAEE